MSQFTDDAGREWTVRIDITAIKRVRGKVTDARSGKPVDLATAMEGTLLGRLLSDPLLLSDVVYLLVDTEDQGVSEEDFSRAMSGDAIDAAGQALIDALAVFFGQRGDLVRSAAKKYQALEAMAWDATSELFNSGRLEDKMKQALQDVQAKLDKATFGIPSTGREE